LETTSPSNNQASLPQFQKENVDAVTLAAASIRTVDLNDPNHPVAQDYAFYQHQKKFTTGLGSRIVEHYKPHTLLTRPPSPQDITLELLIASQAHIGHATSLWNPANARYIFGIRGDTDPIHIIAPDQTASHLRRACKVVAGVAERGGLILFVGTRQGQARAVVRAAELAKGCHLFTKWIPGSITNGQQILGKCDKKVVNELDEEVPGFEDQLFDKPAVKPDLVVCLNPLENYILLHECGLNNIPTIGIIDTDANPTWVTYPIPANDDSLRAVQVIAGVLGRAAQQGQEIRLATAARTGQIVYPATHGLERPVQDDRRGRRPGQLRQRIRAARTPLPSSASDDDDGPLFPEDDLDPPDARQLEHDAKLLQAAEDTLLEQQGVSSVAEAMGVAGGRAGAGAGADDVVVDADEPLDVDRAAEDIHASFGGHQEVLDASLLDDRYGVAADATAAARERSDDLAQFGIHSLPFEPEREVASSAEPAPAPIEQAREVGEEVNRKLSRAPPEAAWAEDPVVGKKND
jgi:ribosomal protein S2